MTFPRSAWPRRDVVNDETLEALAASLIAELPQRVALPEIGFVAEALKDRGLEAARGATDFAGLFIGFSLFLIVAAALLVGLFFRLAVEGRADELGLRLAIGESVRTVRKVFLREGGALGALGVLVGLVGAVLYAATIMAALRTVWQSAVGSTRLELHVEPLSLALGAVLSMAVILFTIWRAVRRLVTLPVPALLRGSTQDPSAQGAKSVPTTRTRASWLALASGVLALILLLVSTQVEGTMVAAFFFGVGACLVVSGLALVSLLVTRFRPIEVGPRFGTTGGLARANAGLNPGRNLLCVALVACASFVIVAVGAYGLRFGEELRNRGSGAGGFGLVAQTDLPVHQDLSTPDGRFELGLDDETSALLEGSEVMPFRVLPGDDVSCLNLYQPRQPRVLSVPPELIERGGFHFNATLEPDIPSSEHSDNPWALLEQDFGDDVVPAFGDANSVMWILKSGLGKDVEMINEAGRTVRLRLVGLLRKSIFQSELLISEACDARAFSEPRWLRVLLDRCPA